MACSQHGDVGDGRGGPPEQRGRRWPGARPRYLLHARPVRERLARLRRVPRRRPRKRPPRPASASPARPSATRTSNLAHLAGLLDEASAAARRSIRRARRTVSLGGSAAWTASSMAPAAIALTPTTSCDLGCQRRLRHGARRLLDMLDFTVVYRVARWAPTPSVTCIRQSCRCEQGTSSGVAAHVGSRCMRTFPVRTAPSNLQSDHKQVGTTSCTPAAGRLLAAYTRRPDRQPTRRARGHPRHRVVQDRPEPGRFCPGASPASRPCSTTSGLQSSACASRRRRSAATLA